MLPKPKGITRITRNSVERLALLLANNVIQPHNIAQIPIPDQVNMLIKCLPYLVEKKSSEIAEDKKTKTSITSMIESSFKEKKHLDN